MRSQSVLLHLGPVVLAAACSGPPADPGAVIVQPESVTPLSDSAKRPGATALTLAEDFFLGQGVDLSIVYDAADESGARSRGEFWVRCALVGEEALDEEGFEDL